MPNFFTDNGPKAFHLNFDLLKTIIELREGKDADAQAVYQQYLRQLDIVGDIAGNKIAPRAAQVDDDSATCADGIVTYAPGTAQNLQDLTAAGLMGVMLPRQYGGLNMPVSVYTMMTEMISRADASLQNLFGLQDIAETIKLFGTEEQKQRYLPKFATGEYDGAMCLTEPEAGSDLQSAKTTATLGDDGVWRINGLKHFITNGCAKVLLVLARSEPGTGDARGLSLFIVQPSAGLHINRIEDKMGIHGSPTCEIQFTDAPGELLGQRRFGLIKYVMSLMNGARLAISSQATGLSEAARTLAHEYTSQRTQFGKPISNLQPVADMLDRMDALTEAERTLLYETCAYVDLRDGFEERATLDKTDRDAREKAKLYTKITGLLTPMTKYFTTEGANSIAYDTIQCMGGKGYMHERIAERFYRDARIMNIYEGTSQMQVVAATPGICTHVIDPLVDQLIAEVTGVPGTDKLLERIIAARAIANQAIDTVQQHPEALERMAKRLLRMQTLVFVALLMLRNVKRDPNRLAITTHFVREFLPEVAYNSAMIDSYFAEL